MAKSTDCKLAFIQMRAEGQSYTHISQALNISKSTCTAWAEELAASIDTARQERLQELYTEYSLTKDARIKQLGDTLERIDKALEDIDLSQLPAAQLLKYKLEYTQALKDEYSQPAPLMEEASYRTAFNAYANLLYRLQSGIVTESQARVELAILGKLESSQDKIEGDIFSLPGL